MSNWTPKIQTGVTAEVIFGLLSRKCKGKGICRVSLEAPDSPENKCRRGSAILSNTTDQRLQFDFIKTSLSKCTMTALFGNQLFSVETDFKMPLEVLDPLGRKNYVIRAGTYPIREKLLFFSVVF